MSQPMEHRTVTANQARTEYLATCNEIIEIELVLVFLDQAITSSLNTAEPIVALSNDKVAMYATNAFWQLLDVPRGLHPVPQPVRHPRLRMRGLAVGFGRINRG